MTLKKWSLALIAAALVAPVSASALGISIVNVTSSSGSSVLGNNDTITFDLLLENATNEQINGIGIGVYGYDEGVPGSTLDNRLEFVSGSTSASVFNVVYNGGTPFGGLAASAPLVEIGAAFPFFETRRVQLFGGIATVPVDGDGTQDVGVDGLQTNGADAHMRVTFAANALPGASDVTLTFGTGQFGDDVIGPAGSLAFTNDTYTVTIIPEPGTALLMGLGLAGLATTRRR